MAAAVLTAKTAAQTGEGKLCYTPVDIVQVQDMTSSFDELWSALADQISAVLNEIYEINPESRFGMATFGDKPLSNEETGVSLGYDYDYCLKVDIPLSQPSPDDVAELMKGYLSKAGGGGGDWPEGVLEGMQRTLLTDQFVWREGVNSSRLLLVVTDAVSHIEGDVQNIAGLKINENKLTRSDLKSGANAKCNLVDYPSIKQVAKLLKDSDTQVLFLAAPGGFWSNGRFSPYSSIAIKGKEYRGEDNLVKWYQDEFTKEGVQIYSVLVDPEMKTYASSFKEVLSRFQTWRCEESTTTTSTTTTTTTITSQTSEQVPDDVTDTTAAESTTVAPTTTAASTTVTSAVTSTVPTSSSSAAFTTTGTSTVTVPTPVASTTGASTVPTPVASTTGTLPISSSSVSSTATSSIPTTGTSTVSVPTPVASTTGTSTVPTPVASTTGTSTVSVPTPVASTTGTVETSPSPSISPPETGTTAVTDNGDCSPGCCGGEIAIGIEIGVGGKGSVELNCGENSQTYTVSC